MLAKSLFISAFFFSRFFKIVHTLRMHSNLSFCFFESGLPHSGILFFGFDMHRQKVFNGL